jgi:hypothetical protein
MIPGLCELGKCPQFPFFLKRLDDEDKIRYDTNDLMIHRPNQPVGSIEGGWR